MRRRTISAFLGAPVCVSLFAGCAQEASREAMAAKVGRPACAKPFFADQVLYEGDKDGFRYVKVRSIHNYLGDREYKVAADQWPMDRPMRYTGNPRRWQDVTWMNGDAGGFPQDPFLYATPSFPEGAPTTQPTNAPGATMQFDANPTTAPDVVPPLDQPGTGATNPSPGAGEAQPIVPPGLTQGAATQPAGAQP